MAAQTHTISRWEEEVEGVPSVLRFVSQRLEYEGKAGGGAQKLTHHTTLL